MHADERHEAPTFRKTCCPECEGRGVVGDYSMGRMAPEPYCEKLCPKCHGSGEINPHVA